MSLPEKTPMSIRPRLKLRATLPSLKSDLIRLKLNQTRSPGPLARRIILNGHSIKVRRSIKFLRALSPLWKFNNLALASFDFVIPPIQVKERAAWSWYRTALLCERSAENLKTGGINQRAWVSANFHHPSECSLNAKAMIEENNLLTTRPSYAREMLDQSITALLDKAANAKAHALKLYRDIEKEVDAPSWGEAYTAGVPICHAYK
jgi:hypothetical protein